MIVVVGRPRGVVLIVLEVDLQRVERDVFRRTVDIAVDGLIPGELRRLEVVFP